MRGMELRLAGIILLKMTAHGAAKETIEMAKKTKKNDADNSNDSNGTKGRTPEELKAQREASKKKRQEAASKAIQKAVDLNGTVLTATMTESLADRIVALRDVIVEIESVRSQVSDAVRSKDFRASIMIIVDQADKSARAAWDLALDRIRDLEAK